MEKKKLYNPTFLTIFILIQKFILFIFQNLTSRYERKKSLVGLILDDETC